VMELAFEHVRHGLFALPRSVETTNTGARSSFHGRQNQTPPIASQECG
jgi:hypothetical protein